ncbi:hypothetical protein FRC07_003607 [Ceratobasidium sp. 392]|nr:hypothetical protein FRC07_003607 [Ceratobasidium sp. 392]
MTRVAQKGKFLIFYAHPAPANKQCALLLVGSALSRTSYKTSPAAVTASMPALPAQLPMRPTYPPAAPTLHRGAACLECRRRKLKCDGIRPVCGCCERGRRPKECDYDPPEGRAFRLQQRIRELEETIHALESQPRRSNRSSPGSSAAPRAQRSPNSALPTVQAPYSHPNLIASHHLPASVDWSPFMPSMEMHSPGLSYDVYSPATPTGPFRQGRSGEEWLFNAPLGSLAGLVDTDPLTAFAHLALMPPTTMLDPGSVALLSIASFMARRREYGLQVDEERLLTSFALPPDHPAAVHPALRNAVYLLSCRSLNGQTPALAQYEAPFVDKVRQGIADALEAAHRGDNTHLFTGVILASTLLARYLLIMGRIREAYHQIASVARFGRFGQTRAWWQWLISAFTQLPSSRAPPLLPPPTDHIALGERIHAFWAIFALDRTIVAVAGLPSAFGDDGSDHVDACEKITTQWPRPLSEYRSPELLAQSGPSGSLADCFSGGSPRGSPNSKPSNLNVCTLAMRALEIHHRVHEVFRHSGSGTSTRLPLLNRSVLRFLREAPTADSFDNDDSPRAGLNPMLVLAYSLIFTAKMKLVLAQHGRAAYTPANGDEAVHAAAQLAGMLRRTQNVAGLDPIVGICVAFTLGFLKRIGHGAATDELIEQLERSLAQLRKAHVVLGERA